MKGKNTPITMLKKSPENKNNTTKNRTLLLQNWGEAKGVKQETMCKKEGKIEEARPKQVQQIKEKKEKRAKL